MIFLQFLLSAHELEPGIEDEVAAVPRESGLFTAKTPRHEGLLNNPQILQITQIKYLDQQ